VSRTRRRGEPQRVGSLVSGVLGDLGLGESARALRVAEGWEQAVGAEVARHCRPGILRDGVLEAVVDSSAWCHQLQLRRPQLLEALRESLGEDAPRDLWLRIGPR
jgi:predicted nucleic acid-binding Zn ribbon protein